MKISASMIVKNEQEMLAKCLKSINQVDEICITDTGSEDKSIEIAKQFGAKVYTEYKWNDNFAEARNVSKSQCTGDWLLIIDADEVLETTMPTIRKRLSEVSDDTNALMFRVNTGRESNDQLRIFRNSPNIQWLGAAHNLPYLMEGNKAHKMPGIEYTDFKIKANFSPNHHRDPDRTLRIMTSELRKGPQALGNYQFTRYLYYVSREWLNRKEPLKAIYYLEDYTKFAPPTNEMADAWFLLASCYVDVGKMEKAIDACFQAVKFQPMYKAPWALIHNLAHDSVKKIWEKVFHLANNEGVLFVRKDAEKLIKSKKDEKK